MALVGTVRATLSGGEAPYVLGPYVDGTGKKIPPSEIALVKAFSNGELAYGKPVFHCSGKGLLGFANEFKRSLSPMPLFCWDHFPGESTRIPIELSSVGSRNAISLTLDFEEANIVGKNGIIHIMGMLKPTETVSE